MKFIILLGFLATSVLALSPHFIEDAKKKAGEIAERCITDSGVSPADMTNIKTMHAPTTHEGKCFIMCFQKHMGLLNDNGKLDENSAMAHLDKLKEDDEEMYNTIHDIFQKCYNEVTDEDDPCDTAAKLSGCLKKLATAAGLNEGLLSGDK